MMNCIIGIGTAIAQSTYKKRSLQNQTTHLVDICLGAVIHKILNAYIRNPCGSPNQNQILFRSSVVR